MENHHQRPSGDQPMNNAVRSEVQQILTASTGEETLTELLMEQIVSSRNMNRAYKRVKANRGAAGIDGMTVDELPIWIAKHKE